MKRLLFTLTLILSGFALQAKATVTEVTLSEREVELPVDVSTAKMKLSRSGYSSPTVKVLIPELAAVTFLDHRNPEEAAPCMATYDAVTPAEVIQDNPAVEKVTFKIALNKTAQIYQQDGLCHVSLTETIEGTIRGFKFEHERYADLGTRHADDCR